MPRGAHPLHLGWILRAGGRWNRQGEYGALYTALHPFGALLEHSKYFGAPNLGGLTKPRDLVSLRVTVNPVLDLRDAAWLGAYPNWPASVLGNTDSCREVCRSLADDAIDMGFRAIRVPSSMIPGNSALDNLVIFVNGPAHGLDLMEGPDRYPITTAGSIEPEAWPRLFANYPTLKLPGMEHWPL